MADPPAGTAVVTGATGGIGSAVVRRLGDHGFRVVAVARPSEGFDALCAQTSAVPAPLDLSGPIGLPAALAGLDRVDVLVHAAGIADVASIEDSPPDLWQRTMAINVMGPAELTRALLPGLRAAGGQGGAHRAGRLAAGGGGSARSAGDQHLSGRRRDRAAAHGAGGVRDRVRRLAEAAAPSLTLCAGIQFCAQNLVGCAHRCAAWRRAWDSNPRGAVNS